MFSKNQKILLAPHSPMSIVLKEYLVSSGYEVVGFIDKNKTDIDIYKIDKLDDVVFDIVLILSPNHFKAIYKEYLEYLPKEVIYKVTIQDYKYEFINDIKIKENKFVRPKNLQIENKFAVISNDFISSNNKFFYIYCIKHNISVTMLTTNQKQIQELEKHHLPYKILDTQEGYEEILTAKYIILDQGNYNDLPPLDKNQRIIQLWHGVGLKKMSKLTNVTYDYFVSTSDWTNETNFKNIFLAKEFLNTGYPRNDVLNKEYKNRYSELFCDENILNFVKDTNSKIALYMPTHRATKVELPLDFEKLNRQLKDINFTMIVKLHPLVLEYYTDIEQQKFSNILFHNTQGDIYPLLNFVDVLISDYSSIVYDFLLLDRPIIFFNYDFDIYLKTIELLFDYDEYSPGIKVKNQDDLIKALTNKDNYKKERNKMKKLFFDDTYKDSCKNIIDIINL